MAEKVMIIAQLRVGRPEETLLPKTRAGSEPAAVLSAGDELTT